MAEAGELNLSIVLCESTKAQVDVQIMEKGTFADLEQSVVEIWPFFVF